MTAPPPDRDETERRTSFERAARETRTSLVGDFLAFLRHNKKWWLLPLVLVLLALGALALLGGTAAAPFIYTLF